MVLWICLLHIYGHQFKWCESLLGVKTTPYFKSVDNYKNCGHHLQLEAVNISPPPCPLHQEQCSVGYISETPQLTATFLCWHGMIFLWNCFILILIHCVQCSTAVEVQDEAQESNGDIIHGLSGMYSFIGNCSPVPWYLQTPRFVVSESWRGSTGTHETGIKDRASLTTDSVSKFCVHTRCCEKEIVLGTHWSSPIQYHLEMSDV